MTGAVASGPEGDRRHTALSAAKDVVPARLPVGSFAARLSITAKFLLAVLLALTPITAVLVLGWIMQLMRRESAIALVMYAQKTKRRGAISVLHNSEDLTSLAPFPGWWTGLWSTIKAGVAATFAIGAVTLPFGVVLLVAWWAGWENSFNKGYEQAWVGPTLGLTGMAIGVFVLSHLPMALAHFAAERRFSSIFEIGLIRRLIRAVRWRYLLFSVVAVLLAAPLYLSQILPTFMENIRPELINASAEEVSEFALRWHLAWTVYLIVALFIVRRWSARLYARAVLNALPERVTFARSIMQITAITPDTIADQHRGWLGGVVPGLIIGAFWLGFIVLLFISQFANHAWWNWINQAMIGLPWVFRPF